MSEIELNGANFESEVLKSDIPVVVDFYADWCGPCKMMAPVLKQLVDGLQGKIKVAKFNVDVDNQLAGKYGISSIPCLILFKGGEEADRLVGFKPLPELQKWVGKHV